MQPLPALCIGGRCGRTQEGNAHATRLCLPPRVLLQAKAFRTWYVGVQERKRMRMVGQRIAKRMMQADVARAFYTWLVRARTCSCVRARA